MIIHDFVTGLYIYHAFYSYSSMSSFYYKKNVDWETVSCVMPAPFSHVSRLPHLLVALRSLVLDLICCCLHLVKPKLTVFIKCLVVYSNILGLYTHSPWTHPGQLQPRKVYHCLNFILPLYWSFPVFRYTDAYLCVVVSYSIQDSNMLCEFMAWEQRALCMVQACSRPRYIGLCGALYDVHKTQQIT